MILFLAFNWDFGIVLNISLFSLFRLSFVYLKNTSTSTPPPHSPGGFMFLYF
jgi:hypothetical protein